MFLGGESISTFVLVLLATFVLMHQQHPFTESPHQHIKRKLAKILSSGSLPAVWDARGFELESIRVLIGYFRHQLKR